MKCTYYGHACFALEMGGTTLLFDPFLSPNPLAKAINADAIPADLILVSHGHADHLADAVAIAHRTKAPIIAPYEVAEWLAAQGVASVQHVNPGGSKLLPCGTVKVVAAVHSSTLPDGTPGGVPVGFVVRGAEGSFYYSGDTALTQDMKLIAEDGEVGVAILPIGDTFTMGAKDAARAAQWVGARRVVGVHYDTFPPITIDRAAARSAFESVGVELLLPAIGETITL
jgi:L-ascorbate metabolism protein UlaG (beta-lactamase superfamily)